MDNSNVIALDRKYFNSTMNYTLALLNAFDHLYYYTQEIRNDEYISDNAYQVPISFGNYEKSMILKDINEKEITSGSVNYVPRLVLTFTSLTKAPERQTQKYQRFSKRVYHPDNNDVVLDMSYNSLAYDFQFTLLLQSRGLTMASQLTEQILSKFNPSMNLNIKEFPLFSDFTQTQILTDDPEFEIIEEFEDTQVNIINTVFNITIRGNIYSEVGYKGPIKTIEMFTHVWDEFTYQQSKLSSFYKLDVDYKESGKVKTETIRSFNGTIPYNEDVKLPLEEMKEKRPDFIPPEVVNEINEINEER